MIMTKIKILVWSPLVNPGGGSRLLEQLITAMTRHPEVTAVGFATSAGNTIPAQILDSSVVLHFVGQRTVWRRVRNTITGFGKNFKGPMKGFIHSFERKAARRVLRQEQNDLKKLASAYDVVYVPWPHLQDFPDLGKPVVCTFQDATLLEYPEILGGQRTRQEMHNTQHWIEKVTSAVVSSHSTRVILARYMGERCLEYPIIHHAIVPDHRSPSSRTSSRGLPPKYLVYPGNITTHKNHYNLLLAWSRFERRQEFPLVLFGSGTDLLTRSFRDPYPENLQALRLIGLVQRLGLKPGTDFYALGFVNDEEVLPLVQAATALIMPSQAEGGGSFPVEEALNLGVPVLCSDIPVMREHLAYRSAEVAWFDPDSYESILRAVRLMFENYPAYRQSAQQGMNDARPTWDSIAAEYVTVFQQAVQKG